MTQGVMKRPALWRRLRARRVGSTLQRRACPRLFMMALLVLGGRYRRFGRQFSRHWLETAVRPTCKQFLAVTVMAGVAGFVITWWYPQAQAPGQVLRPILA